jgi:hypothetical protein
MGCAVIVLGLLLTFGVVGGACRGCLRGPYAPSIVDMIGDGSLGSYDIKSLEFLQHDPGNGWPFTEDDYARLPRTALTKRSALDQLATILQKHTRAGHLFKNHPATIYSGILKVDCGDKGHFYVYYSLMYRDEYYVALTANSANETNPNCAKEYYSKALVDFLQNNDPKFKGLR